jgi:hypothetical protein
MIRRQAIFLRDTIQGFLVLDRDMLDIVQRDIMRSRKDTSRSQDSRFCRLPIGNNQFGALMGQAEQLRVL